MQKNKGRFNNFIELIKGKKTVNNFKKYDKSITLKDYWITFGLCLVISFAYAYFIYKNIIFSSIFSLGITVIFVNYIMLLRKKKLYNTHIRKQINLYMSLVSQMVSAKQTILNALITIAPNLQSPIKEDVYQLIRSIEVDGYPYDALDKFSDKYSNDTYLRIFHNQLKLTFRHGGNEDILSELVDEHSSLEVYVDEYSKKKGFYKNYTYIFMAYLLIFPIMFVIFQGSMYENYVSSTFGLIVSSGIYIITTLIAMIVEKKYLDDTLVEF